MLNGVSDPNNKNVLMRAMSYLMMIGNSHKVDKIVTKHNMPIKPTAWYDVHPL